MQQDTEGTNASSPTSRDLVLQQQLLADFGSYALSSDDLGNVLNEACRMVAQGLGEGLSKIVEHRDGELVVVASYGFDLAPEEMVLGKAGGTSAGHALETGSPTVSGDVLGDERFRRATIERGGEVLSVLNVPIPNLVDADIDWYGVIETDSTRKNAFSEDQVAFLKFYADLVAAAIERRETQSRLEALVKDKQRLLDELQHRIKNNLAIITGLVRLQTRKADNDETVEQLSSIEQRIDALRLLHDQLYSHHTSNEVELDQYLSSMVENFIDFYGSDVENIEFETHFDSVTASIDQAIPLGLIINEFVTNSLKYAFGDTGGEITILMHTENQSVRLELRDNGAGLAMSSDRSAGTGMMLIRGLAGQIGAAPEWNTEQGTVLRLDFELKSERRNGTEAPSVA